VLALEAVLRHLLPLEVQTKARAGLRMLGETVICVYRTAPEEALGARGTWPASLSASMTPARSMYSTHACAPGSSPLARPCPSSASLLLPHQLGVH
jgi:hypothetical protein